ncbi:MAG: LacI family DNA-binding transcriptional regulator [Chelatococcus sp.]|nr:LacI family DNA-binding transcriptional regulator [Chelatococcus sp. HY11]MBX3536935.1 LacI family DNA-binding transcriptional regulator [Chelatococcus sp.]MBX3543629.1 LacI family DNA-binding transcriptional regulator [Chelatococcus sp.]MCO5076329.1 LacI family DNA-binding transcriptional regulator [Chelatococcus sp.]
MPRDTVPKKTRSPRRRSATSAVTMADVAAAAGVSTQTVSRALRDSSSVSDETLQRIQEAVRNTHYVQNFAASHLASNRSMTVAAIIPAISTSIFAETIQGLSDVLLPEGYQVFLGHTDYVAQREEDLIRSLSGRRPDGFFIIGTHHTRDATHILKRAGVPVVESWGLTSRPVDLVVGFSNHAAMKTVVNHLADRGYQRLTFAGVMKPGDHRAKDRLKGFLDAHGERFPGVEPQVTTATSNSMIMATGAELLDLVRSNYPKTDAIVFTSDVLASGAVLRCNDLGVQVPQDLAITGFGNYDIAGHLRPSLTTVAIASRRIGMLSAELLLARMQDKPITERVVDIGFQLLVRDSS